MGRASIQIVIFLVFLNAAAGAVTASGLGSALDINPEIGADEEIDRVESDMQEVDTAQGIRDTLFAMFSTTTTTAVSAFTILLYGPVMLANLGIPGWLLTFLFAPAFVIVGIDTIHFLTGRDG